MEPIAYTKASGFRLWNPERGQRDKRQSYPFDVPVMPDQGSAHRPTGWVRCRMEVAPFRYNLGPLGVSYIPKITVTLIDPIDNSDVRVLRVVEERKEYLHRDRALKRAAVAGEAIYEHLVRHGVRQSQVTKIPLEFVEVDDGEERGQEQSNAAADDNSPMPDERS